MLELPSVGRPHTFFPGKLHWLGTGSSSPSVLWAGTQPPAGSRPVTGTKGSSSMGGGKRRLITACPGHASRGTVPSHHPQPQHTAV